MLRSSLWGRSAIDRDGSVVPFMILSIFLCHMKQQHGLSMLIHRMKINGLLADISFYAKEDSLKEPGKRSKA